MTTTTNNQRVQIPAYTDRWSMGDRYGEIVRTSFMAAKDIHPSIRPRGYGDDERVEIARVKLDISGKATLVILNDCTPV